MISIAEDTLSVVSHVIILLNTIEKYLRSISAGNEIPLNLTCREMSTSNDYIMSLAKLYEQTFVYSNPLNLLKSLYNLNVSFLTLLCRTLLCPYLP